MDAAHITIATVWALFWLGWLAAAVGAKRSRLSASWTGPTVLVRVVVAAAVIVFVPTRLHGAGGTLVTDPLLQWLGVGLLLLGLGTAVWARVSLGRNWGTPMSERVEPELITSGPYRRIRHPIYTGLIVAMLGTAIAVSPYLFVAVAVLGGYFVWSAFVEERSMARLFPTAYAAYRRTTKMLVPFVV